jgi:hypothetical protein
MGMATSARAAIAGAMKRTASAAMMALKPPIDVVLPRSGSTDEIHAAGPRDL